jgi:hypothetical protein
VNGHVFAPYPDRVNARGRFFRCRLCGTWGQEDYFSGKILTILSCDETRAADILFERIEGEKDF